MVIILKDSVRQIHFKKESKCSNSKCDSEWTILIICVNCHYILCKEHFNVWKQKHVDLGEFHHHAIIFTRVFLSRNEGYIMQEFEKMKKEDYYFKPIAINRDEMKIIKETKDFQFFEYIIPKEHFINLINRKDVVIQ